NRRLHADLVDAGSFAKHLGGAGPGAAPAENVGLKNRAGRGELVVVEDLADELRDIDMCWACAGARGVEAIKAAGSLNPGPVQRERRRHVAEPLFQALL